MEICLATETSAAAPTKSSPWCLYRSSVEASFFMLELRAGNTRCRKSCLAPCVDVGGSISMVEYPGCSAHSKKLAVVELAER